MPELCSSSIIEQWAITYKGRTLLIVSSREEAERTIKGKENVCKIEPVITYLEK